MLTNHESKQREEDPAPWCWSILLIIWSILWHHRRHHHHRHLDHHLDHLDHAQNNVHAHLGDQHWRVCSVDRRESSRQDPANNQDREALNANIIKHYQRIKTGRLWTKTLSLWEGFPTWVQVLWQARKGWQGRRKTKLSASDQIWGFLLQNLASFSFWTNRMVFIS